MIGAKLANHLFKPFLVHQIANVVGVKTNIISLRAFQAVEPPMAGHIYYINQNKNALGPGSIKLEVFA